MKLGKKLAIVKWLIIKIFPERIRAAIYRDYASQKRQIYTNSGQALQYVLGRKRFESLARDILIAEGVGVDESLGKEPETIRWLNSIPQRGCLWDIGANVGVYSVYAAVVKKKKVVSFEPSLNNCYALASNFAANDLSPSDCIIMPIALDSSNSIQTLYMMNPRVGGSGNSFGRAACADGSPMSHVAEQVTLGVTINMLVDEFGLSVPDSIKIDVDGNELLILRGGSKVLANPILQDLSIEIDSARDALVSQILELLHSYAFELTGIYQGGRYEGNSTIKNYHFSRVS